MRRVIHSLTEHLFDYAGLFPPASLDIEKALKNYSTYQIHPYQKMLGKFILPIKKHDEYLSLTRNNQKRTPLSIILTPVQTLKNLSENLKVDCLKIGEIVKNSPSSSIDSFEMVFPKEFYRESQTSIIEYFTEIFASLSFSLESQNSLEGKNFDFFCEIPYLKNSELEHFLPAVQNYNSLDSRNEVFIKLRTGGITPDLVPSVSSLSHLLFNIGKYDLPFKVTAGLHIPVPNFNELVGTKMHGFLNVLFASLCSFLKCQSLSEFQTKTFNISLVENILEHLTYENIEAKDDSLILNIPNQEENKFEFTLNMIQSFRQDYFKGIGTCDFFEPIEYLNTEIPFL